MKSESGLTPSSTRKNKNSARFEIVLFVLVALVAGTFVAWLSDVVLHQSGINVDHEDTVETLEWRVDALESDQDRE